MLRLSQGFWGVTRQSIGSVSSTTLRRTLPPGPVASATWARARSPCGTIESGQMARSTKPAFVDVGNPAMAIECPNCGLLTPRFEQHCRNCGFSLWPSGPFVAAAFKAWQSADPTRGAARRFDLELPAQPRAELVDYEERAHRLGIHLFPSS